MVVNSVQCSPVWAGAVGVLVGYFPRARDGVVPGRRERPRVAREAGRGCRHWFPTAPTLNVNAKYFVMRVARA